IAPAGDVGVEALQLVDVLTDHLEVNDWLSHGSLLSVVVCRSGAGRRVLAALVGGHARREWPLDHGRAAAAAGRAVGLRLGGATVRAARAGIRLERVAPETSEAVVVRVAREILELGLVLDRPPDQPHPVEDRDLED